MLKFLIIILLATVVSSQSFARLRKCSNSNPKLVAKLEKGSWQESWSKIIESEVFFETPKTYTVRTPPRGNVKKWTKRKQKFSFLTYNNSTIEDICPGYNGSVEKKKIFWFQLFHELANKESLHCRSNLINFNGGKNVGLYQIDPDPQKRSYYKLDIPKGKVRGGINLLSAKKNIKAAAQMAAILILRDGFLGKKSGLASYWQPLRATNKKNRKNRKIILNNVTEACNANVAFAHTNIDSWKKIVAKSSDSNVSDSLVFEDGEVPLVYYVDEEGEEYINDEKDDINNDPVADAWSKYLDEMEN